MAETEPIHAILERATKAAVGERLDEAASLLGEVLAREPANLRALDLFGFVRFFQRRFADAEQFCRRALAIEPDRAYARKGLGLCLAKQHRLDEGRAELERAIALKPAWFDPYWDLAVVLMEAGRYGDALEVLGRARAAVPDRTAELDELRADVERRKAAT